MLLELTQWLAKDIRAFSVFNYITLRAVLAQAGQARMADRFGMQPNLARLAVKFGLKVPEAYVSAIP